MTVTETGIRVTRVGEGPFPPGTPVQYRKVGRGRVTEHACPAERPCTGHVEPVHRYQVAFETGRYKGTTRQVWVPDSGDLSAPCGGDGCGNRPTVRVGGGLRPLCAACADRTALPTLRRLRVVPGDSPVPTVAEALAAVNAARPERFHQGGGLGFLAMQASDAERYAGPDNQFAALAVELLTLRRLADAVRADTQARLEYLRNEIRAERISYGEIAELQSLVHCIEAGDTELLEWAGVPEQETR